MTPAVLQWYTTRLGTPAWAQGKVWQAPVSTVYLPAWKLHEVWGLSRKLCLESFVALHAKARLFLATEGFKTTFDDTAQRRLLPCHVPMLH